MGIILILLVPIAMWVLALKLDKNSKAQKVFWVLSLTLTGALSSIPLVLIPMIMHVDANRKHSYDWNGIWVAFVYPIIFLIFGVIGLIIGIMTRYKRQKNTLKTKHIEIIKRR